MDHQPGATHEALPLDPENDIDAGKAFWWFVGSSVVLFGCLWILVPIFVQVQDFEINKKVNLSPTNQLNDVKDAENEFLNGGNPTKKNIDDVVKNWK
tara:strand:+ start:38992 stop:39282 length:291 start_codon:yes stop_codon:yes gene_type:complete